MAPYLLTGFESEEEAKRESRRWMEERKGIDLSDPNKTTTHLVGWVKVSESSQEEWALRIPEDYLEYVTEEEKKSDRFVEVEHPKRYDFNTPHMYRYMPQKYIDKFFESGLIRLSSFSRFSEHEDEVRRDQSEGHNILRGEGQTTVHAVTGHGHNAYVLCGSTIESDDLTERFGVNGYFKIRDTRSFAFEILSSLDEMHGDVGCRGVIEGFCLYQDERVITRSIDLDLEQLQDKHEGGVGIERLGEVTSQIAGTDAYFVKSKEYQEECEYRILWMMNERVDGVIDVKCPNALEHCEKVI